ncbi:MAG: C39 family peptidase [Nanoarchaeota archaeon]|nr:C39 family peptidase [Nanoarchaeota archaeon]
MIPFPFHKQKTAYTCGAASMRMALEVCGIKKPEKEIAKALKTNKIRGTWHKHFPEFAEKHKLDYTVKRDADIDDLKGYKKRGYVIIVCYLYPPGKIDHYSVLKRIDKNYIYFWDPLFGKDHRYSLSYFKKIWRSSPRYDNEKSWFFAIKK